MLYDVEGAKPEEDQTCETWGGGVWFRTITERARAREREREKRRTGKGREETAREMGATHNTIHGGSIGVRGKWSFGHGQRAKEGTWSQDLGPLWELHSVRSDREEKSKDMVDDKGHLGEEGPAAGYGWRLLGAGGPVGDGGETCTTKAYYNGHMRTTSRTLCT
ncbi:hypothetical protein M406DRAFT_325690 [Cryphonectria parasitica EP155]|uniref:Uncharacterized protein n=1 Tax=Cryphonectria parasitica (strain ATCC 38755 / EP155) TaxID=660469 RepID=A0A9P5CTD8_CRYP1|nr:uncharacterized protein M406DRAFT_325690 [Cryphonectria parasitica EP155]KAF3770238.1 hypothetical protein M406DRAFT_325690 [Cryphonectria parasitica EP155]